MKTTDIDYNLLALLEVLYEERNQSRAAPRLGISQPAVSSGLRRLRETYRDTLFVGRDMTPTTKAEQLYQQVHGGLSQIRQAVGETQAFNPSASSRHYTLAIGYSNGCIRGSCLFERIHAASCGMSLTIRTIDPFEALPNLLRQRALDAAISHIPAQDGGLSTQRLSDRKLSVLCRPRHPLLRPGFGEAELQRVGLACVHMDDHAVETTRNDWLKRMLSKQTRLTVSTAMMLLSALQNTDLAAVTICELADIGVSQFGLEAHPLPFEYEPIPVYLAWHRPMDNDPEHQWLREQIREIW